MTSKRFGKRKEHFRVCKRVENKYILELNQWAIVTVHIVAMVV